MQDAPIRRSRQRQPKSSTAIECMVRPILHSACLHPTQGLMTSTPVRPKPVASRVTTVIPCTNAVAAIRASRSPCGSGTCSLAHRRATSVSIGSTRSAKAGRTRWSIHARRTPPCTGSRRSASSTPSSSSRIVMTDTKRLDGRTPIAHAVTCLSALPSFAFRSSETTLVSSTHGIHQARSAARATEPRRRGGSNSMSATPGIASMSAMFSCAPASF